MILLVGVTLLTFQPRPSFYLTTQTVRPQFANSPLILANLKERLLGPSVDLGRFRPQETLPDGTEIWGPPQDSPLAGTIRVRVRNGQVVGQEVVPTSGKPNARPLN